MGDGYIPPENINLPFRFTEAGYSPPNSTAMLFNFAPKGNFRNLSAAVDVMQLNVDSTYTYVKSCPKYTIGYGSGNIQIIRGRCLFGGIRDLQSTINGISVAFTIGGLSAYINGVLESEVADLLSSCFPIKPCDLSSYLGAHTPENLNTSIYGIKKAGTQDISSMVGTHSPAEMSLYVSVHQPAVLPSSINSIKFNSTSTIYSEVDMHSPCNITSTITSHNPTNLTSMLFTKQAGVSNISSYIRSWDKTELGSVIYSHLYRNLNSMVYGSGKGIVDIPSSIYGERHKGMYDVGSVIRTHLPINLGSIIACYRSEIGDIGSAVHGWQKGQDLSSIIDSHNYINLGMSISGTKSETSNLYNSIHGWNIKSISSVIKTHQSGKIGSSVRGLGSHSGNVASSVRALYKDNIVNISSGIGIHQPVYLTAIIQMHQPSDLRSILGSHLSEQLHSSIRSWYTHNTSDLSSGNFGWEKIDLSAKLGGAPPLDFRSLIRPWYTGIEYNLPSSLHGWQESPILHSNIESHPYFNIHSNIRAWITGSVGNLSINIRSWDYTYLQASVLTHPYSEIGTAIRGWSVESLKNITGKIAVWQESYIKAGIDSHTWDTLGAKLYPHAPPPIYASIRSWHRLLTSQLPSKIRGWQDSSIGSKIASHRYASFSILLKGVVIEASRNIGGNIHGWQQLELSSTIEEHKPSNIGMLLKGVVLGAIRDLKPRIHSWQEANIGMTIPGGHYPSNIVAYINIFQKSYKTLKSYIRGWIQVDMQSNIYAALPVNIQSSIRAWYTDLTMDLRGCTFGWAVGDLPSFSGSHLPENLLGLVHGYAERYIRSHLHGYQESYISTVISTHNPISIHSSIVPRIKVSKFLLSILHGWQIDSIGMSIKGGHSPVDIASCLRVNQTDISLVTSYLHAWHTKGLSSLLNIVFPYDLNSIIYLIEPVNLSGYLNVRYTKSLPSILMAWQNNNLSATIYQIWHKELYAKVLAHERVDYNLKSLIKGYSNAATFITGSIVPFHFVNIQAVLRATYIANIKSYLYAIQPENLHGEIHSWHERYLQVMLVGENYLWDLTASIVSRGGLNNIRANLTPVKFPMISKSITVNIHPWEIRYLGAIVTGTNVVFLPAAITPLGFSGNIHASIIPKMIRLTTVISVSTLSHSDMSAIINYPCFMTNFRDLNSIIYSKYKGDLFAYIKPTKPLFMNRSLSAKIGYTDSFLETNKLDINIKIYPNEFITENKYKLHLYLLDAELLLKASIRGTLRYNNISAYINCERIPSFNFDYPIKNREMVIHKTYDGIFKTSEVVEMAFKSIVDDYFYNSSGDFAWKRSRFDKWMLDVKSILPPNTALRLARRLHKATTLYDLREFGNIDSALKFTIAYVTEYPQASLSASIINVGRYETLGSMIYPRYVKKSVFSLTSTLTPVGQNVIISDGYNIIKKS